MAFPALRRLAWTALLGLLSAGCATGQRPTVGAVEPFPAGLLTGDPATDAVLTLLDDGPTGDLTVEYSTERVYDPKTTLAKLEVIGDGRQITIGDWLFRQEIGAASTCQVGAPESTCVDGFRQERISDTNLTTEFWGPGAATRLRRDAAIRIGPGTESTQTIAGHQARCVTVPLSAGTPKICAFTDGVLAVMDEGDVRVTATSITLGAGPTAPGSTGG